MQANERQPSRMHQTVNDLVLAEMFLLQATIESITAIGDGLSELMSADSRPPLKSLLQRTRDEALEPYSTRYKYFRKLIKRQDKD